MSKPFIGRKYDKLIRHEASKAHIHTQSMFFVKLKSGKFHIVSTVVDVARQIPVVTESSQKMVKLSKTCFA